MTVGELIEALKAFDPGAVVVIDDADTGWLLHVETVEKDDNEGGAIKIAGSYHSSEGNYSDGYGNWR